MKKLITTLSIVLLFSGCAEQLYLSSDFDRTADFSTYKTYALAKDQEKPGNTSPMFDNELNRKRIKEAIEKEMKSMGLAQSDWEPDLLIDFHITIDQQTDYIVHNNYPFRYRYWPSYDVASYTFKKGALVIHIVDTKKEQLVWQGVGSKRLDDVPPRDLEAKIQEAVKAIFSQYPNRR
ncbi:DUF4136 domain-containing protein [Roseivirga echinicomitans]|uniref:DUF4136 domain-containing protein n=1 Tax=Roseivirga echinicomitans TaxID=296218 RepID=A0A150XUP5_9BACT|nr:DUF4136 domain-containing protein [Roseivirga echinicomitans]KYG82478.1 hypothetical protein AWN68_14585 [Roseivirga echinicomitans]